MRDWDREWKESRIPKAQRIMKLLRSHYGHGNSDLMMLDVGCYEGIMEAEFSKHIKGRVVAIDISLQAVRNASISIKNENIDNVDFIVADARCLPIKPNIIDWIVCNQVIDYLEEKEKVVSEFTRIMAEDGLLYLSVISKKFLTLYRFFPFLSFTYLGPFYGRTYPSMEAPFGTPMTYGYWKRVFSNFAMHDATLVTAFRQTGESQHESLRRSNPFITLFSSMLPSWIFIIAKRKPIRAE